MLQCNEDTISEIAKKCPEIANQSKENEYKNVVNIKK